MQDCDTLLVIGSSFPYTQFMPDLDQARAVQIDIDPHMVGLRYPFEVNLVGDAGETLRRLLPQLKRKKHGKWRKKIEKDTARWWEVMERRAAVEADPINPEYVVHALDALLPDDVILAADSGSSANWYARHLRMRGGMRGSLSGTLATMGPGVPYVIGAKFAHPDRPCIALVGDGAMQMNGLAELITAAKYWQEWADPRLIVAVLNNQDLNQVTWEMRAMSGAPQFLPSQSLPDVPYADFARSIGLDGVRVEKPGEVEAAWRQALARRPAVRHRLPHRPGRAADPAARLPRPDRGRGRGDRQGRQRPHRHDPPGPQGQGPGDAPGPQAPPRLRQRRHQVIGSPTPRWSRRSGPPPTPWRPTHRKATAPWRGTRPPWWWPRPAAGDTTGLGYTYGAPETAAVHPPQTGARWSPAAPPGTSRRPTRR